MFAVAYCQELRIPKAQTAQHTLANINVYRFIKIICTLCNLKKKNLKKKQEKKTKRKRVMRTYQNEKPSAKYLYTHKRYIITHSSSSEQHKFSSFMFAFTPIMLMLATAYTSITMKLCHSLRLCKLAE